MRLLQARLIPMKNRDLFDYLTLKASFCVIVLVFLPSCKDEADSQRVAAQIPESKVKSEANDDGSVMTKLDDIGDSLASTVNNDTDLELLLAKHSSSEVVRLLRRAFEKSDDRVALARRLLSNYSGSSPTRVAVELSTAMAQWPADYTTVVMSEVPSSSHKRLIGRHLALHHVTKNRSAVEAVYKTLEPGKLRVSACVSLSRLDYETNGIDSALKTISSFPFDSEKSGSLAGLLSALNSSPNTITIGEFNKIKESSQNLQESQKIQFYIERLFRSGKVVGN
jgi:hypothetical protein